LHARLRRGASVAVRSSECRARAQKNDAPTQEPQAMSVGRAHAQAMPLMLPAGTLLFSPTAVDTPPIPRSRV